MAQALLLQLFIQDLLRNASDLLVGRIEEGPKLLEADGAGDCGQTGLGGEECRQASMLTGWVSGPTPSSIDVQQADCSCRYCSRWWWATCTGRIRRQAGTDELDSGILQNAGFGNPPGASSTDTHSVFAVQAALLSFLKPHEGHRTQPVQWPHLTEQACVLFQEPSQVDLEFAGVHALQEHSQQA